MEHSGLLYDTQAVNAGHLNVQKEEIYGLRMQIGDRFGSVLTLGYDVHVWLGSEQQLQSLPSQRFVVDGNRAQHHAFARSNGIWIVT
jgi:hypothetical protein